MSIIRVLIIFCLFETVCFCQGLQEELKGFIYEINIPTIAKGNIPKIRTGTCFVINDSICGFMLATCRHVLQDDSGFYYDKIMVRQNNLLRQGDIISDTSKFQVLLKKDEHNYYIEDDDSSIDLVIVLLKNENVTAPHNNTLAGIKSKKIIDKVQFDILNLSEGVNVELIGFSLSSSLYNDKPHYHFSRFGQIGLLTGNKFTLKIDHKLKTAEFILLDMIVRPGDSGSPIISTINGSKIITRYYSRHVTIHGIRGWLPDLLS